MKASVLEILQRCFPTGTGHQNRAARKRSTDLAKAPIWPPDVFGAAALLLERSGLYQFLSPGRIDRFDKPWFIFTDKETKEWHAAAQEWRSKIAVPPLVQELWSRLLYLGTNSVLGKSPGLGRDIPDWVKIAYALMIISDEASENVGYVKLEADPDTISWVNGLDIYFEAEWVKRFNKKRSKSSSKHVLLNFHRFSIGQFLSPDMLSVQPKARTPQVGATLRTVSQHLSLLSPSSRIGATWQRIGSDRPDVKPDLNLLLIPFPYDIKLDWFAGIDAAPVGSAPGKASGWGWFDIEQQWLPKNPAIFTDFVCALIKKAEDDAERLRIAEKRPVEETVRIDGIILPEYSLTWAHHLHLVEHLAKINDEIEFVVSGSRTNCEKAEGNFALTSTINRTSTNAPMIHTNSRGKHHRWRLEKTQIQAYNLQDKLDEKLMWWEGIALHKRMVHTHVFRESSAFTTFICEDLARSDPCHETVRSLGPNIVFCLLMDNVQIPVRWPGRYAAALAEDPGSAVLTLTSRALIARAAQCETNKENARDALKRACGEGYARPANWSIGLWRDDVGPSARELHCPPGDHAVLLQLKNQAVEDNSYDDRCDTAGARWVYSKASTVALAKADQAFEALERSKKLFPKKPKPSSAGVSTP